MFHFLVSVALSGSWESVMAIGSLAGSASERGWRVAERNRGRLGDKAEGGFRKELRGKT